MHGAPQYTCEGHKSWLYTCNLKQIRVKTSYYNKWGSVEGRQFIFSSSYEPGIFLSYVQHIHMCPLDMYIKSFWPFQQRCLVIYPILPSFVFSKMLNGFHWSLHWNCSIKVLCLHVDYKRWSMKKFLFFLVGKLHSWSRVEACAKNVFHL